MLPVYTVNNAKQICIDNRKGSIEVGKDADFNIFNEDLLTADPEGISFMKSAEVFIKGEKTVVFIIRRE